MAYEVFQRTSFRVEDPALSLTPDGRIGLNAPAVRLLREANVKFVLLLWDKSNRKIALKAAVKSDTNAYAVSGMGSHSATIRARPFLRHVGWNGLKRITLPAMWREKDNMLEIIVPKGSVRADA